MLNKFSCLILGFALLSKGPFGFLISRLFYKYPRLALDGLNGSAKKSSLFSINPTAMFFKTLSDKD